MDLSDKKKIIGEEEKEGVSQRNRLQSRTPTTAADSIPDYHFPDYS